MDFHARPVVVVARRRVALCATGVRYKLLPNVSGGIRDYLHVTNFVPHHDGVAALRTMRSIEARLRSQLYQEPFNKQMSMGTHRSVTVV